MHHAVVPWRIEQTKPISRRLPGGRLRVMLLEVLVSQNVENSFHLDSEIGQSGPEAARIPGPLAPRQMSTGTWSCSSFREFEILMQLGSEVSRPPPGPVMAAAAGPRPRARPGASRAVGVTGTVTSRAGPGRPCRRTMQK